MSEIERLLREAIMLANAHCVNNISGVSGAIHALAAAKVAGASSAEPVAHIEHTVGGGIRWSHVIKAAYALPMGVEFALYTAPTSRTESSAEPVAWVNKSTLASAAISREQGHFDTWSDEKTPYHDTPLYAVPTSSDLLTRFGGMPFGEARKIILEMDADAARGMAISLLIQLNIADKYLPQPNQGTKP